MGALGLVVNGMILWNTLYMEEVMDHLRRSDVAIASEDLARLSPLGHDHINFLGRYNFLRTEQVARGELRPLNFGDTDEYP